MAMKTATLAAAAAVKGAAPGGLRALLYSTSSFPFGQPQTPTEKPPAAEPSVNLFVSGLSKRTTTDGLKQAFAKFGEVVDARVVTDRASGYSKGFGFVRYATLEEAENGRTGMDGQFLDGWVIFAEYARPRKPPPPLNSFQNGTNNNPPHWRT